jgi:hypothetical protein
MPATSYTLTSNHPNQSRLVVITKVQSNWLEIQFFMLEQNTLRYTTIL